MDDKKVVEDLGQYITNEYGLLREILSNLNPIDLWSARLVCRMERADYMMDVIEDLSNEYLATKCVPANIVGGGDGPQNGFGLRKLPEKKEKVCKCCSGTNHPEGKVRRSRTVKWKATVDLIVNKDPIVLHSRKVGKKFPPPVVPQRILPTLVIQQHLFENSRNQSLEICRRCGREFYVCPCVISTPRTAFISISCTREKCSYEEHMVVNVGTHTRANLSRAGCGGKW
ncbi:hypothetical protein J6590_100490 [Homalodisca vitripennis]|nr:hypothetical protein J6590_100490 [Homalodisca vitripennis]